jgi:excisionase family DNA binding protein
MKPHNGSSSPYLTPAEACALAGVAPTTLKRWADAGILAHVKTAGGHRRFLRADLERFLSRRTRIEPETSPEANPWVAKLVGGPAHEVEAELLRARARFGSWHQVAEELGGVLVEIGARWQRGELSLVDEHIASERLARALARIGEALPSRPGAPRALLACLGGEEHALGLALVELCLRELGWTTLWAGPRTPLADLERILDGMQLEMLALSASQGSSDADELAAATRALEEACAARGIALALGGLGAWPESPRYAHRFREFEGFHRFTVELGATRERG